MISINVKPFSFITLFLFSIAYIPFDRFLRLENISNEK